MAYKIGIDARTLIYPDNVNRGIGHYTLNHLRAVMNLTPESRYVFCFEERKDNDLLSVLLSLPNAEIAAYGSSTFPKLDLFHLPDPMSVMLGYDSPFNVMPKDVPATMVFYDLIPLTLADIHYNTWHERVQLAYRVRLKQLQQSQAKILAISECTKRDLIQHLTLSPDRITNISAGVNRDSINGTYSVNEIQEVTSRFGLSWPFFLMVGGLDAHKNFNAAIAAHVNAQQQMNSFLVVVGSLNHDPTKLYYKQQLEKDRIPRVIFTDYISRHDLECLYSAATSLLFPSYYEGFGFPVLEAMANNCPVICSNAASLPEVYGNAAIPVEPANSKKLMDTMVALANEGPNGPTRQLLIQQGQFQSQRFSWEETARKTIATWQQLLAR